MIEEVEINREELYNLVYTWTVHVGIKRIPEDMDEESFKRGAFVFLEKLSGLVPEIKERC